MEDNSQSVEAIARLAREGMEIKAVEHEDGSSSIIAPWGAQIERRQPVNPVLPNHIKQAVAIDEADSMVQYVDRFKTERSMLFASLSQQHILARLDYHDAESKLPQQDSHNAKLALPFSIPWTRWREIDGKPMSQSAVAYFFEEMVYTIAAPDGATLMETAKDLNIDRQVKFKKGVNNNDGTASLTYEEEDTTRGKNGETITIPNEVTIVAPIFQGGEPHTFTAKLRYRMKDGDLFFVFDILNREEGEQQAFRTICDQIGTACELPVIYGKTAERF